MRSTFAIIGLLVGGLAWADPPRLISVTVKGQVGTPGTVRVDADDRWPLLKALVRADGLNECAATEQILVQRDSQVLTVGRYSEMRLQEGDVITVNPMRGTVVSSLEKPRQVNFTHRTLRDMLGAPCFGGYRGLVAHYSPLEKDYLWSDARFFDGGSYTYIELEDQDLIVLTKRELANPVTIPVEGELRKPGPARVEAGASVLEALVAIEGFNPNADLHSVVLVREGKEQVLKDLESLATTRVLPQDRLRVEPLSQIRVNVQGEVHDCGWHLVSRTSSDPMGDAVRAAGGTTNSETLYRVSAEPWWSVLVQRCSEKSTKAVENRSTIWVVPQECTIHGTVDRPGSVELKRTDNLLSVVKASGAERGQLNRVQVVRATARNQGWQTYDLTSPESASKVTVGDGDEIFVPGPGEDYAPVPNDSYWNFFRTLPMPQLR